MKLLLYLFLLLAVPLAGQNSQAAVGKSAPGLYCRNTIIAGMYNTDYSRGVEVGDGLFFGYRWFNIGGLVKMQPGRKRSNIDVQRQSALLIGARINLKKNYFYLTVGPGRQVEHFTRTIYYQPYNKAMGNYGENLIAKGVLVHIEWITKFSGGNSGIGLYTTLFMSSDNTAVGFGGNFMFGTQQ